MLVGLKIIASYSLVHGPISAVLIYMHTTYMNIASYIRTHKYFSYMFVWYVYIYMFVCLL